MRRGTGYGTFAAIVAALLVLSASAPAHAAWTRQYNGLGQDQGYFDVSAADAQHAMAVGVHRDPSSGNSEASLAVTVDGATWTTQKPAGSLFYTCVEMSDASTAFVGGMGALLVTRDGGGTWTTYREADWGPLRGPTITGVSFAGATNGFLVGSGGAVRRTTDGGATWNVVDPPVAGASLGGVQALDANRVWVWGGSSETDPDTGEVLRYSGGLLALSTNGGATWQVVFQDEARSVGRVFMLNATEGWMISMSMSGPRFEHTTNGGLAWTDVAVPAGAAGAPDTVFDVTFFDRCEGFLLAEREEATQLFYTRDRGVTWTEEDLSSLAFPNPLLPAFPIPLRMACFEFPSRDVGFAGGFFESLSGYTADGAGTSCGGGLTDGGVNPGGGGESGCGCRAADSGGTASILLVALGALLGLVRRRRASRSGR
jgi:MYXO-CTERM domain-containing protein